MVANPIWIAGYGGTPTGGASPVWIVGYGGAIAGATESWIAGYGGTPAAGASPVWVKGYGGTPTGGASPIWIGGYLTEGIGVLPGSPVNTVAPVASGTLTVGSTLSCTTGTWTNSPTSYQYAWSGAGSPRNASTYVVVASDAGRSISCTVTAINAIGPGLSAASNALSILGVPANTAAPVASGSLTVGSTLTTTNGTWTNSPTFTYQWQRGGANISGATSSTYITVSADGGTSVGCLVTATNSSGSASQASNTLAIAAGGATSVWSAADATANGMTLTNGGLTVASTTATRQTIRGSISKTSGKLYIEFATSTSASTEMFAGATSVAILASYLGSTSFSVGFWSSGATLVSGFTELFNATAYAPVAGDVMAVAIDFTAGNVWFAVNNVWENSGNPTAGTGMLATFTPATVGALFPGLTLNDSTSGTWTLRSQPAQQTYLPPPGFQAWDGGPVTPSTSVWSASDAAIKGFTLTNGGLTATAPAGVNANQFLRSTVSATSGKLYVEFKATQTSGNDFFGLASASANAGLAMGNSSYSAAIGYGGNNISAGFTSNATTTAFPANNDVWALAVDFTAGNFWLAQNNVWLASGNPATGSLPMVSFVPATVGALFPALTMENTGEVWTLQPTAASQKYAPPAGFSPWDGAGGHSSQALAYLARTVGGNEGGNGTNIANLIDGLVSDGVWAKLDALYVLAQQNATDARLNLVSASYPLTGSATFTAYQGFSAFAAGGLDTGLLPLTTVQFTLNSASIGAWAYNAPLGGIFLGTSASVAQVTLLPRFSDGNYYVGINASNGTSETPSPATNGWYSADRTGPGTVPMYFDAVLKNTDGAPSVALENIDFAIGDIPAGGFTATSTISAAFIGASLGSAGQLALYNRLRTYMTAIGVP